MFVNIPIVQKLKYYNDLENIINNIVDYNKIMKDIRKNIKPTTTLYKSYSNYISNNDKIYEIPLRSFTLDPSIGYKFNKSKKCCFIETIVKKN